jgi:hypothetical protein
VDDVVRQALEAMHRRDWTRVEQCVHPYVHWTDAGGTTRRGRGKLLAMLSAMSEVALETDELRGGQIYRLRIQSAKVPD